MAFECHWCAELNSSTSPRSVISPPMLTNKAELKRFILQLKNDMPSRSNAVTRLDEADGALSTRRSTDYD